MDNIESLTAAAQADLRALLFDLRADSVTRSGLVNALIERAQFFRLRHGMTVRTELGPEPTLGGPCQEALYGIAREALHNAAKHARASQVELNLLHSSQGLVLEIRDDGIGFDPRAPRQRNYGLQSMRERAAESGIELRVDSVSGQGTRVIAIVPSAIQSIEGDVPSPCWESGGR